MSDSTDSPEHEAVESSEPAANEPRPEHRHRRWIPSLAISGDAVALVGAGGAVVLAILGLLGVAPRALTALASIAIGAGLLGHGALVTKRLAEHAGPPGATAERAKIGEASGDEVLGATAAITLGILALIGLAPLLLLGVSAIAVGGALVLSAPARTEIPRIARGVEPYRSASALELASLVMIIAGLGGVALGIVAVSGASHALALIQIAFLALGCALIATALLEGAHLARAVHHRTAAERRVASAAG